MRELAFAGLTDGGDLLLTSGDGQQYSLTVDERLTAAVRGDRPRLGQLSIALEGASPRDIQARVRHGQSPEQIADQTGIALDRVERFAGPPLAERAHIAALARHTEVRRSEGDEQLEVLVLAVLQGADIEPNELEWDSWRRDDGRWTVLARWPGGSEELAGGEAAWTYDHAGRSVTPTDAAARVLQGEPEPVPESEQVRRMHLVLAQDGELDLDGPASPWGEPGPADIARAAAAWDDEEDPDAALTAVVDRYSGEVLDLAPGPPAEPDTSLADLLQTDPGTARTHAKSTRRERRKGTRPAAPAPAPAPAKQSGGRSRAVVPSWDEILFGARRPDE